MTIPQPTPLSKKSPALRALAIGLACLGVCVFAWGLRYKLSLYDPPHAISRHMPAAKLLTGKDRNTSVLVHAPRRTSHLLPLIFSTGGLVLIGWTAARCTVALRSFLLLIVPADVAFPAARSFFSFVRPPPHRR